MKMREPLPNRTECDLLEMGMAEQKFDPASIPDREKLLKAEKSFSRL